MEKKEKEGGKRRYQFSDVYPFSEEGSGATGNPRKEREQRGGKDPALAEKTGSVADAAPRRRRKGRKKKKKSERSSRVLLSHFRKKPHR